MFACSMINSGVKIDKETMVRIENSPQYSDGEFNRMENQMDWSVSDFVSSTWKFLFGGDNRTPDIPVPVKSADLSFFNYKEKGKLYITWLGHSSLMINIDGYKILTDPVFEDKVSFFGPTRYNGEIPLDIDNLENIDAVVISHDHYDHLNKYSIQHLTERTDIFYVPLGVAARIRDWGVPGNKIVEMDWWEESRFDAGLSLTAAPVQHFSGRGLTDRNSTLAASWIIITSGHKIFFSGDSGYFDGFKKIGEKFGPFDMTFIECGAYNEKWAKIHMFPEETVKAHLDLKGKVLHPIHWGTFNLALHPWYEPMERLVTAAEEKGIETATPVVGETTIYGEYHPAEKWWEQSMNDQNLNAGGNGQIEKVQTKNLNEYK